MFRTELTPPLRALSAFALFTGSLFATPSVTLDRVQQRYPWNGLVDIDYTIGYDAGEAELDPATDRLRFQVVNNLTHETNVAVRINGCQPLPVAAGKHRVTWDANADGVVFQSTDVTITLEVVHYGPKYLIIDVSEGPSATNYPVAYTNLPPAGGFNTEEYKGNKIVLRLIPPGVFVAGSPTTEKNRKAENEGQHSVVISKPFYIGIFETTQKQYENVSGKNNPASVYPGDYRPKENVSYNDLIGAYSRTKWPDTDEVDSTTFFGKLRAKTSGLAFFLPTEAQWEYACRAGTTSDFGNGVVCADTDKQTAQMRLLGRFVNNQVEDGSGYATYHTTVGSYQPNAYGLYDMHGNVWELCCDWWRPNVAELEQLVDPRGGMVFRYGRVERGGGYGSAASDCRSASRAELSVGNNGTAQRSESCGFRLVLPVND